jgi:nitrogen fixation/metabolism regulation signal transduction histidine kinase
LIVQLSFTIVLTAVFIITNAALMAQSMTRPLLRLTASAKAMERGNLTREQAAELEQTEGHDEIAQLSHLFGSMAKEVIQREEGLMQKVEELQILIDERQRSEQVEEIVETDFFRELKERARSMRQRNQQQRRSKMI